ncbi:calcium-binding protein [Leptothoe sp. LEGE 181152]|nr:calcium-binding protein [Leptothoe sp. LEGE 181152]
MANIYGTNYNDNGTFNGFPFIFRSSLYGTIFNDNIYGFNGNDTMYGYAGNDYLNGGYGNDYLDGGYGNDSMYGGYGNDTYVVNSSFDKVVEYFGQGIDTVKSSVSYTLGNYVENLTLTGSAYRGNGNSYGNVLRGNNYNNALYGYSGNDTIYAYGGHDYLDGGYGNDSMYGGYGNDTYVVNSTLDKVVEYFGQGVDTVKSSVSYTLGNYVENLTLTGSAYRGTGNSYSNVLRGNNYNNALYGYSGNDTIYAYGGHDYLDGGYGNDSMYGGYGNDTYVVNSSFDKVVEYFGQGIDTVKSSVSYTLGNYVENLTLTGSAYRGTGNSYSNVLRGNNYNNALYGYSGNDTIYAYGGHDYLDGGYGNDSMYGGYGNDTYVVNSTLDKVVEYFGQGVDTVKSSVSYTLGNYVENLTLTGSAYRGTGNSYSNVLKGNNYNNVLSGLNGHDSMYGYSGHDSMYGGYGNDSMYGGYGNDYISGGHGNDSMYGGAGNDTIIGGKGSDVLVGGGGYDILYGGKGSNTDRDKFVIGSEYKGSGYATIKDFFGHVNDHFHIVGHELDTIQLGKSDRYSFHQQNGDVIIKYRGTNDWAAVVENVTYAELKDNIVYV